MTHHRLWLAPAFLLCALCPPAGGAGKPRAKAPATTTAPAMATKASAAEGYDRDGMQVEATYGQLPAEQVAARVSERMPAIKRCFDDLAGRLWFLAGELELKGRVARDGSVRSVALTRSNVGSHEVERCIIGVIKELRLPPPQGGEGEFTYPLEFTSSERSRQVARWPDAKIAPEMARHQGEVTTCLKKRRPLQVTVYIGPGGKVASAGLAAEEPIDERAAACLVKRVSDWILPDPLGQLAKASYAFP